MNAIELLSTITAFSKHISTEYHSEIVTKLYKEILEVNDLNTLALSVYVVSNYYNHSTEFIPFIKDLKHSELSKKFFSIVSPVLIEKITEFSDDQFATICAGVGRRSVNLVDVDVIYDLMDAIEKELLHRRAKRMSLDNLVDVSAGFYNNNLGSDELAKTITGKIMEKRKDLSYFNGVDYALNMSEREVCNKELLNTVNTLIKANLCKEDFLKICRYVINTECKDEDLIQKVLSLSTEFRSFDEQNYFELKKFQYYISRYFNQHITDQFLEKVETSGFTFYAKRLLKDKTEIENPCFKEFSNWLNYLKQSCVGPFVYLNHDLVHWA